MKVQSLILVAIFFYIAYTQMVDGKPRKDCQTSCGNFTFEYPFGISPGCYYDDDPDVFHLTCNEKEKLVFGDNFEVIDISHSGELRVWNDVSYVCYDTQGNEKGKEYYIYTLTNVSLSNKNKFNVVGCNALALLITVGKQNYSTGCVSTCNSPSTENEDCNGVGCCRTAVSVPLDSYEFHTSLSRLENMTSAYDSINPCKYAFLAEIGTFQFSAVTA